MLQRHEPRFYVRYIAVDGERICHDVIDACTGNRLYRTRSQPSAAMAAERYNAIACVCPELADGQPDSRIAALTKALTTLGGTHFDLLRYVREHRIAVNGADHSTASYQEAMRRLIIQHALEATLCARCQALSSDSCRPMASTGS